MIHFGLIFVKGGKLYFNFFSFACGYTTVSAPFVRKTVFAPLYAFAALSEIKCCCIYVGLFLGSVFCPIDLFDNSFTDITVLITVAS